jgi:hypothetical protein
MRKSQASFAVASNGNAVKYFITLPREGREVTSGEG